MNKRAVLETLKALYIPKTLSEFKTEEEVRNWANKIVSLMKIVDNPQGYLQCENASHKFNFSTLSRDLYETCFNTIRSELAKSIETIELEIEMENELQKQTYFPNESHLDIQTHVAKIINQSVKTLYICDAYMDEKIIEELTEVKAPNIKLLTHQPKNLFLQRLKAAQSQFSKTKKIEARISNNIHDRLYIIDDAKVWICGTSYNNAGGKPTTIMMLEPLVEKQKAIDDFNSLWNTASVIS